MGKKSGVQKTRETNSRDADVCPKKEYVHLGVPGFESICEHGVPLGSSVLVAGGAGSGKTIFCLQVLQHHAHRGAKCLYLSFEESRERLLSHMHDFGWRPHDLLKSGTLSIERTSPFEISRGVEALLMKEKGELLIDVDPVILPKDFKPQFVVVDSISAIASVFTQREDSYRIYIEQLFRFFERLGATVFLITETRQVPTTYSQMGVEEFLADGVIVLYSLKRGNTRENALEILKLRGAKHLKRVVSMQITDTGITIYPDQEVFGGLDAREG